ncbi:hypothetical protein [Nocardia sp. NPDC052566]
MRGNPMRVHQNEASASGNAACTSSTDPIASVISGDPGLDVVAHLDNK